MTEKAKSKKTKASETPDDLRMRLIDAYKVYMLINGEPPKSIFSFCRENKIREDEFYNHFGSFDSLEKAIWQSFIENTLTVLNQSPEYNDYRFREKLLSFYYTLIETMKQNRSYILSTYKKRSDREILPTYLKGLRVSFKEYISGLIETGLQTEEIKKRQFISDKYDEGLWIQFLFVLNFWINDDSKAFEKTDAAIEKAVKLSTELMSDSAFDSFIDFTKFVIQNSR
jgi:AcrR family transcriptional regulator